MMFRRLEPETETMMTVDGLIDRQHDSDSTWYYLTKLFRSLSDACSYEFHFEWISSFVATTTRSYTLHDFSIASSRCSENSKSVKNPQLNAIFSLRTDRCCAVVSMILVSFLVRSRNRNKMPINSIWSLHFHFFFLRRCFLSESRKKTLEEKLLQLFKKFQKKLNFYFPLN